MVGAGLLALAVRLSAADYPELAGAVSLAGAIVMALGLVLRRGAPVTLGLALAGAGYALSLVGKGLDPAASLFAGGFVLVAELAYWALEPGAHVSLGRAATARRALLSGALALGSVVLGAGLLAAASAPLRGDAVFGLAGVVAVVVVLATTVALLYSLRGGAR